MKVNDLLGGEILNIHYSKEPNVLEVHTTKGILRVVIDGCSLEGHGELISHDNDFLYLEVIELLKYNGPIGRYKIMLETKKG